MNEYKILFCENCKIIQKAYYEGLSFKPLTGDVYCFHKYMETKKKNKMIYI